MTRWLLMPVGMKKKWRLFAHIKWAKKEEIYPDPFKQGFFSIDMQFNDCIQFTRFLPGQITDGFFVKFVSLVWNVRNYEKSFCTSLSSLNDV